MADRSFDACVMLGVLEFVRDPPKLFATVASKLVDGGLFGVTVPNKIPAKYERQLQIRTYRPEDVEAQIKKAGFEVLRKEKFMGYAVSVTVVNYTGFLARLKRTEGKSAGGAAAAGASVDAASSGAGSAAAVETKGSVSDAAAAGAASGSAAESKAAAAVVAAAGDSVAASLEARAAEPAAGRRDAPGERAGASPAGAGSVAAAADSVALSDGFARLKVS